MDVIVNEVTASVRMVDGRELLDRNTLADIVRAVMAAIQDADDSQRRRRAETRIEDDGRGGLMAGVAGGELL